MERRKPQEPESQRTPPNDHEHAMVLILATSLLDHYDGSLAGRAPKVPGFDQVVPQLWITMARAAAVVAAGEGPQELDEDDMEMCEVARRWLHNALEQSYTSDVIHPSAQILMELGQLDLIHQAVDKKEPDTLRDPHLFFEEASVLLADAAKLSPARPDILSDLCQALLVRSCVKGADKPALLEEALRRSDEAIACFTEAHRYLAATGELHPSYTRALSQGGMLRWLLASTTKDLDEKRSLLQEARQQMRQAAEGGLDQPEFLLVCGEAALRLGWLPGSPQTRRNHFADACEQLAAVLAAEPDHTLALRAWGSALAGRAGLAHGNRERKQALQEADERFAALARLEPDASEPFEDAARAWLRLAAEPSAAAAKEGALRAVAAARKASSLTPGSGDYFLACGLSRLGETAEAARTLAAALARDPAQVDRALSDPHLDPVWQLKPAWRRELAAVRAART